MHLRIKSTIEVEQNKIVVHFQYCCIKIALWGYMPVINRTDQLILQYLNCVNKNIFYWYKWCDFSKYRIKVIINKYKLGSPKVNQCRKTNNPSNHLMIKGVQILMLGPNLTTDFSRIFMDQCQVIGHLVT